MLIYFADLMALDERRWRAVLAEALTCETDSVLPCERCEACVLNRNNTNPDVLWIRQQEGKATVGVEEIRSVQEEISTAPQFGKYKILLFEHAGENDSTSTECIVENVGRTSFLYCNDP